MFRQIKYLLVETKPEVKMTKIVAMNCTPVGIESVVTTDKRLVYIDWLDTFLIEFTGKFDKLGNELFTNDIVEIGEGDAKEMFIIGWSQGSFTASHLKDPEKGFMVSDEVKIMQTTKVGNVYTHESVIAEYLKQFADKKMEGTEGEITLQQ